MIMGFKCWICYYMIIWSICLPYWLWFHDFSVYYVSMWLPDSSVILLISDYPLTMLLCDYLIRLVAMLVCNHLIYPLIMLYLFQLFRGLWLSISILICYLGLPWLYLWLVFFHCLWYWFGIIMNDTWLVDLQCLHFCSCYRLMMEIGSTYVICLVDLFSCYAIFWFSYFI